MKFLLPIFILFFSNILPGIACFIETYPEIIFSNTGKAKKTVDIIKNSDCNKNIEILFIDLLTNMEGVISEEKINSLLGEIDNKFNVSIEPKKIRVSKIETIVRQALNLTDNYSFQNFNLVNTNNFIVKNQGDSINISCEACYYPGEKNIKITVTNPVSQRENIFWGNAKLLQAINVVKTKVPLPAFSTLNDNNVHTETIFTDDPTLYSIDLNNLKFFQTNKKINQNVPVKSSDLTPLTLVKAQTPVKAVYKDKNILITIDAIATQNGQINQSIVLSNPQNKKKIIGKVIDYNSVSVGPL